MPFLFWWNTWFGRQLSDKQIAEYLQDDKKPRHIQHALVQIGERMARSDASVTRWYPDVVRLAAYPDRGSAQHRRLGHGPGCQSKERPARDFTKRCLKMLNDLPLTVRGNAALSLVRFGDASGRPQIVALLQPAKVTAPQAGKITDASARGNVDSSEWHRREDSSPDGQTTEVRSPISGRLRAVAPYRAGQTVAAGDEIATIDPGMEQVWEALRALYLIGQPEDIPAIRPYERELPEIPDHVRQQAVATEKAIREREK